MGSVRGILFQFGVIREFWPSGLAISCEIIYCKTRSNCKLNSYGRPSDNVKCLFDLVRFIKFG